ncbi:hypothetical protein IA826_06175 [Listeria seeligeri]|uniref:hypothetical protein n=1 Tax=Listeria seeligeri TaxID=1640 RepID=UPI001629FB9E|nr:hypothetical protein [Listeria seeligeri]MBC2071360.1 hypothetical protein [Listeria seeligeri]MBC2087281.1 hypothetical protein [Listeria seeligeri]MBC2246851.1 hypothetical protein [Listeria seeligeri]MBF2401304.1 hypothetical protein [Listeria seeligeri]MBF2653079.1 hypothetical protein [Listeria seeligeri]
MNYDERVHILVELLIDLSGKLEMMECEEELLCKQKKNFGDAWTSAKTESAYGDLNEAVRKKIKETTEYAKGISKKITKRISSIEAAYKAEYEGHKSLTWRIAEIDPIKYKQKYNEKSNQLKYLSCDGSVKARLINEFQQNNFLELEEQKW